MSVKIIKMPTHEIETSLGIESGGPVHKFFTETCAKHMDKYVPYAEHQGLHLADATVTTDTITYSTPYARYMYEGKVMGPNIPIKDQNGNIIRWISPKKKHLTGKDIDYSKSRANAGHEFAGSHWDKKMWSAEKDDVMKEVADYIKKHGGK